MFPVFGEVFSQLLKQQDSWNHAQIKTSSYLLII